ncbi:MAG TPA: NAD(P)H-dependent glycerol-3-phosphate dehydrogenase [Pseudobacteroides sp.]|uniref:NAD(P)H-dependent glycerol-3-phosphate dehydrogenase n=1 Tax=Pseudobacteroides sp. TaxID=1968840 RepID=UPI002F94C34F
MGKNICVMGAGSWGTALSVQLANNGHNVRMWSFIKEEAEGINTHRENKEKLPGVKVPDKVVCTNDVNDALEGAEAVIMVVPSEFMRSSVKAIKGALKDKMVVVSCSKGLEEGSFLTMSQVINDEAPNVRVVALSGPSHAEEVGRGIPTAVVAASLDSDAALYVQDLFMSPMFRVYTNSDIIGVELGGSIKNVIALCAGISDGLGFGDNTKAALMTRGITEMSRLGEIMGAKQQTFSGLAGIGDLIVTCTSMHSRNRRAGILIGKGKSLEEALKEVAMVVEGVNTTRAAYHMAKKLNVEMPIINQAYEVLFNGKDAKQAVIDLMMRDRKLEIV